MKICCLRLQQLPGGPMCPLHGIPGERKPRPSRAIPGALTHRERPALRPEHVEDMLDGLVEALQRIQAFQDAA